MIKEHDNKRRSFRLVKKRTKKRAKGPKRLKGPKVGDLFLKAPTLLGPLGHLGPLSF